jgi:hypothetical protein
MTQVAWYIVVALFVSVGFLVDKVMEERNKVKSLLKDIDRIEGHYETLVSIEAEGHDRIERDLREQIQNLAERLASIRIQSPGADSDFDRFEKAPEPPQPYSQALQEFLLGIDYEGARAMVEEDIERLRSQGHADEQILQLISEGLTNG